MDDSRLQRTTLLSWTLEIWRDQRRGMPLTGQPAAVAHCMQSHPEWWSDWESAEHTDNAAFIKTRLIHIHADASIRLQIERGLPSQIKILYDAMREKGFTELESIHTIAVAHSEENAKAAENNEGFNLDQYIETATLYVKEALTRPNLTRTAKAKAY